MSNKKTIFISYAHDPKDEKRIMELYKKLKQKGFNVIIDKKSMNQTLAWFKWMRKHILHSSCVIAIFTPSYMSKLETINQKNPCSICSEFHFIEARLNKHGMLNTFFFPVILRSEDSNCIPETFYSYNYFDLSKDGEFDFLVTELAKMIATKSTENTSETAEQNFVSQLSDSPHTTTSCSSFKANPNTQQVYNAKPSKTNKNFSPQEMLSQTLKQNGLLNDTADLKKAYEEYKQLHSQISTLNAAMTAFNKSDLKNNK